MHIYKSRVRSGLQPPPLLNMDTKYPYLIMQNEIEPDMFNFSSLQTLLFGITQIAIGIAILFLPISIHVIAWVLILFGSMFIFLAIYLWIMDVISKASEK